MNRCVLALWMGCLVGGCSLYEDDLIQVTGRGPALTAGRGGSTAGSGGMGGRGGSGGSGGTAGTAGNGGRGGSAGSATTAGSGGSRAMTAGCGDGRVSGGEKCDTGIVAGQPGACPTECPTTTDCIPRKLEGSACQTECVALMQVCMDGDECCPPGCSNATDADCSASCGDDVVQEDEGETCEPDGEAEDQCKTQEDCDAEDDDPCTIDKLMGDAENCNAVCTHEMITAATEGDGCCLPGSDNNADADCEPRCGNGVREADEACDGGDGCDDECHVTRTAAQEACIAEATGSASEACVVCTCTVCTAEMKACRDSGNDTRDMRCEEVAECANEKSCAGDACYCGDYPDRAGCAFFGNGPCRAEVERAAGSTDPVQVEMAGNDPDSALGRAKALGDCTVRNCDDQCRSD